MTINEQPIGDFKVERIPDVCRECGNVIVSCGHYIYGRLMCHICASAALNKHCAGLPLDDAARKIMEMAKITE